MQFEEFIRRYNLTLNEAQCEAAQAVDGATLLLAVPGSGKTTVLVTRLGYMIIGLGIDPASVLTMTYTVAATKDMKDRFCSFSVRSGVARWSSVRSTAFARGSSVLMKR